MNNSLLNNLLILKLAVIPYLANHIASDLGSNLLACNFATKCYQVDLKYTLQRFKSVDDVLQHMKCRLHMRITDYIYHNFDMNFFCFCSLT